MKDEIIHKQDFDIFEHRYKELMQLKADNETYKAIIKEDLKSNFVAIPETVINRIGTGNQYFTKDEILQDLQEEYVKLLKAYNQQRNRTLRQRVFNI
jgi:hypothetical protein